MPLVVIAVTTITCDGTETTPCPDSAVVIHEFPQPVAIRLARKSGWLIGTDILCPDCSLATPQAVPVSEWPSASRRQEAPAVRALKVAVLHA
jgi:hypothetical protein